MKYAGRLRSCRGLLALLLVASVVSACDDDAAKEQEMESWSPTPSVVQGLDVVAESDADGFRLHTASGDKSFLPGINLGSTVPLRQPGEIDALTAEDYRRWFAGMADMGIRVVRNYTLHPPAFYDELAAWNRAHPDAPLLLVQGVYLPDESYVEPGRTLHTPEVDEAFTEELQAVSDAVHGDLTRLRRRGHASGTWTTDVSRWIVSWIVGVEWDPAAVRRTDRIDAHAAYSPGDYFAATDDASATERWIARHMDGLAAAEAKRGVSVPIAFANWPTTDPLEHPEEPLPEEDMAAVDANHVLPTRAWPGGTFASFHAYPYYPDFLRHEPGLQETTWRGRPDPYAGYLVRLKDHFAATMPLLITEFGVPASLGNAHLGPLGRDQGGHSEQEAMQIDADLMRLIHDQGLSGAFVFSWTDEWFKRTWNTMESQDPERRQLWHDALTNEQWFGVVATDSDPIPDSMREALPKTGAIEYLLAEADAAHLNLDLVGRDGPPGHVEILVDTLPGGPADHKIVVDTAQGTARAYVRSELEPIRLYTPQGIDNPDDGEEWHLFRQIVNRAFEVDGREQPAELVDVGELVEGSWDPEADDYDSRATWQVERDAVRLRIPWAMLGLADPSAHTALGAGKPAELVTIDSLPMTISADGSTVDFDYTWPSWNHVTYSERRLAGSDVLADAFRELGRAPRP
ncbi:hypothetical protein ncot_00395 [Nocardioides sp. JQ2195]|uniref:hypothetical protein n=1 Tax=Nocardioides sp. JQ2195 TaxID=2592334 RepID=UPI00143E6EEC|nr:hypothetical protein [Nocardioides sp. JQ2195]QIX25212.1 hypothetical protein ncot_00395 [Nocardioides sp. JQ2195]